MKLAVFLLALIWLFAVLGCQSQPVDESAGIPLNAGVTDVGSVPATPVPYEPAPAPQVVYDSAPAPAPAPVAAPEPQPQPAAPLAAGQQYTVQKGDTLFSLAKNRYGNGNQYPKIISANPGLTPENLQAGQKITIP